MRAVLLAGLMLALALPLSPARAQILRTLRHDIHRVVRPHHYGRYHYRGRHYYHRGPAWRGRYDR